MKHNIYFKEDDRIVFFNLDLIKRIEINYKIRKIYLDELTIGESLFDKLYFALADYLEFSKHKLDRKEKK